MTCSGHSAGPGGCHGWIWWPPTMRISQRPASHREGHCATSSAWPPGVVAGAARSALTVEQASRADRAAWLREDAIGSLRQVRGYGVVDRSPTWRYGRRFWPVARFIGLIPVLPPRSGPPVCGGPCRCSTFRGITTRSGGLDPAGWAISRAFVGTSRAGVRVVGVGDRDRLLCAAAGAAVTAFR